MAFGTSITSTSLFLLEAYKTRRKHVNQLEAAARDMPLASIWRVRHKQHVICAEMLAYSSQVLQAQLHGLRAL